MTDATFIVWHDPGLLTGVAVYDLENGRFESGQYGPDDLRRKLDEYKVRCGGRMAVGYEQFIVTSAGPRSSTPVHAHRAIQIICGFAKQEAIPLLKPQPSSARKLGSVVFLRRLGWYKPGQGHANDAAQHLLSDLLKRTPIPSEIKGRLFPKYDPRGTVAPERS